MTYESGLFLAEGSRLVLDLIKHNPESIHSIYGTSSWTSLNEAKIRKNNISNTIISESQLQSIASLKSTEEVLAVVKMRLSLNDSSEPEPKIIFFLVDIQDPGNFGTLIRTADWFGYSKLLVSPKCVDPFNNKSVQSSMSSIARIELETVDPKLIKRRFPEHKLVVTTMNGSNFEAIDYSSKYIICLGNEAHGLSEEMISGSDIQISIHGKSLGAESLNVAIAGGILMSHFK
jgi:RNA methyltransferase, TrmH family